MVYLLVMLINLINCINNIVEVAINDGDEIIALESIGDKLLQFKSKTLSFINIGGEFPFLESATYGS